jgi:hypothetical protein
MRAPLTRYREALASGAAVASALSLLGDPNGARAATPLGNEFQVNTYTTDDQGASAVATDSNGNFVVVWESLGSPGSDSGYPVPGRGDYHTSFSVQGQRYDASGSPIGQQFQVNTYTTSEQFAPSVSSDAAGNFVVVWESGGSAGTDTGGGSGCSCSSSWSVQGQRYDASGFPVGEQFQVNTYTPHNQLQPSVAMDPSGSFVVVWESFGSAGSETSSYSIQGQRYDARGSRVGREFQVSTDTTDQHRTPAVAIGPNSNFVVVWESIETAGPNNFISWSVQGQRYDASGSPVGRQFQVNTYTAGELAAADPFVAIDPKGNFVVVWDGYGSAGSDNFYSGFSVQGQRYDASGAPVGEQFQVNTDTPSDQADPSVASDSAGNFVVVWDSAGVFGSGDTVSIQGQRFDARGSPVGDQFQINTYATNNHFYPSVAMRPNGNFVVVWDSNGSPGTDTSSSSVQARLFSQRGHANRRFPAKPTR